MHTDQLVNILAHGAGTAPRRTGWRAMGLPLAGATALALAGGMAVLGAVPASDFATPAPWMKLAYTGLLAWALGLAALHAGLPAHPWRGPLRAAGIVFLLMAALGFGVWSQAPAAQQAATVLGRREAYAFPGDAYGADGRRVGAGDPRAEGGTRVRRCPADGRAARRFG
jgi:hypothetical protein